MKRVLVAVAGSAGLLAGAGPALAVSTPAWTAWVQPHPAMGQGGAPITPEIPPARQTANAPVNPSNVGKAAVKNADGADAKQAAGAETPENTGAATPKPAGAGVAGLQAQAGARFDPTGTASAKALKLGLASGDLNVADLFKSAPAAAPAKLLTAYKAKSWLGN